MTAAFWVLVGIVFYVYFAYPILVGLLSRVRPFKVNRQPDEPDISLVVAAYNEEEAIEKKIQNTLSLDYPKERLEVIVVSDGSTDKTADVARRFETEGVKVVELPQNMGKSEAQNAGMAEAGAGLLVFADADIMLKEDALRNLTSYMADDRVGCVIGRHTFENPDTPGVAQGEGAYWRYESKLRGFESRAGNLAVGSGILGIRRELASKLDPDVGEDMVLPLQTAIACRKVIYAQDVVSYNVVLPDQASQLLRVKARIVSKDLRGLWLNRAILNPLKYPLYSWGLVSHKLLRWFVPFFLLGILFTNCWLLGNLSYLALFLAQLVFYILALAGFYIGTEGPKQLRIIAVVLSFCVVNIAAMLGVLRFLSGRRSGRWVPIRERN